MTARFAVGAKVTLDAREGDPYPLHMQTHVLIADADGDVYLVRRAGESRKYGPYAEHRLTPGWGMPDD